MPKAKVTQVCGVEVDPTKYYEVQLGKHVPDFYGVPMSRLAPYHLTGAAALELSALGDNVVASITDSDKHPDAVMADKLDPKVSQVPEPVVIRPVTRVSVPPRRPV